MPSFGIYIYTIHTGSVCFNSLPENHDWFDVGSAKKRANKNKLLEKNITVNGFRTKCERVFFSCLFCLGTDYYESFRFSFHLHIIFWSTEDHISNENFQSVIHFKMNGKKLTNFSYPITALVFYYVRQQFSMHNK